MNSLVFQWIRKRSVAVSVSVSGNRHTMIILRNKFFIPSIISCKNCSRLDLSRYDSTLFRDLSRNEGTSSLDFSKNKVNMSFVPRKV